MLDIAIIRRIEKAIILAGALYVIGFLLTEASFETEEGMDLYLVLISKVIPILFFFGLSLLPYLLFYSVSKAISLKGEGSPYTRASLIVTLLVVPVSCILYYASGKSIEGDPSSTSSLIYAVLPFYIAIIGGFFYGVVYLAARKSS